MRKEHLATAIGIFLVAIGIFTAVIHIITGKAVFILWYCDHLALLGGIIILLKNRYWLNAIINVGAIPVLFWILDYFSNTVFNTNLFGSVTYVFSETNPNLQFVYLQHIYVVPLLIVALWIIGGPVKGAWKASAAYGALLLLAGMALDKNYNINCAQRLCIPYVPDSLFFLIIQYIVMIGGALLTHFILMRSYAKRIKANKKSH